MTTLYETVIIVPMNTNDGVSTSEIRRNFQTFLNETFGGYTSVNGRGSDPHCPMREEPVVIYTVANDNTALSRCKLYGYAWSIAKTLTQVGIYLRWPNGTVQFVGDPSDTIGPPAPWITAPFPVGPRSSKPWPVDPNSPSGESRSDMLRRDAADTRREHGERIAHRNLMNSAW